MTPPLDAAAKCLAHDDPAGALAALLTAWREAPRARVADLIDRVSTLAATSAAPLAGDDAASREAAWKKRAKSPSPADVAVLLAALTAGVKVASVADRIERLGHLDPDPRVAATYLAMLRAPPFTASSQKPLWSEVFRQLEAVHVDPRVCDALPSLADGYTRIFGDTVMGRWMEDHLAKLSQRMTKQIGTKHPSRAPLSSAEASLVAAMEARFTEAQPVAKAEAHDDEDALLRDIAARPSDPAPKERYRAWLAAKGDPRAEFIALQRKRAAEGGLADGDARREAELQKKHQMAWLGPIGPVVAEARFEEGFLVECRLVPKGTKTGAALGDPRWATVETLHCSSAKNYGREVILHPAMASLRTIEGAPGAFVVSLFDDPTPRAFESFAATTQILPRELPATLVAPGLPAVREFDISCWFLDPEVSKYTSRWNEPALFAPFLQSPFAARLRVLRWGIHDLFLDDLARALDDHAPPTFTARVDAFLAAFERGDNGRWSHVIVRLETPEDLEFGAVKMRKVLDLAPERVRRVTVEAKPGLSLAPFDAEIAAIRARFPDADVRLPSS